MQLPSKLAEWLLVNLKNKATELGDLYKFLIVNLNLIMIHYNHEINAIINLMIRTIITPTSWLLAPGNFVYSMR